MQKKEGSCCSWHLLEESLKLLTGIILSQWRHEQDTCGQKLYRNDVEWSNKEI